MAHQVFIDGEAGTTGLQIRDRLARRSDIEVVSIDPARRKDPAARAELLNGVDAVILCLPDEAAQEAVGLITSNSVKVIDASSAHRVSPGWAYGFPEMTPSQRDTIRSAQRVTNPGCWPTGAIALLRPLLDAGWIPTDWPITVHGISGYSGGGKALIAEFEQPTPSVTNDAYRPYGLTLKHKHVPEMRVNAAISHDPLFSPAVGRFAQGMIVEVPLQLWAMPRNPAVSDLRATLEKRYAGERFVEVVGEAECAALQADRAGAAGYVSGLDPEALNGTNRMRLFVFGNESRSQVRLLAQLDNLGKGASGAAVQNLNLMLGLEESAGL